MASGYTRSQLKGKFTTGQGLSETSFTDLIDSLTHPSDLVTAISTEPADNLPLAGTVGYALGQDVASLQSDVLSLKTWKDSAPFPTVSDVATSIGDTYNPLDGRITDLETTTAGHTTTLTSVGSDISSLTSKDTYLEGLITTNASTAATQVGLCLTQADFVTEKLALEASIAGKAASSHTHSEYVTTSDLSSYARLTDLAAKASAIHTHAASEITGLDAIYVTPVQVQALIEQNKVFLDQSTILDDFYDKAEVDFKVSQSVSAAKSEILGDAPIGALDTLKELGDALSDSQDVSVAVTTQISSVNTSITTIQGQVAALEAQVGTGVISQIQSELAQLQASVDASVNEKIAGLQEQVNACMALITLLAGTSSQNNFDDLADVTGEEEATLAITTTETLGAPASEPLQGGFVVTSKSDTPLAGDASYGVVFKGTDNTSQYIAYNNSSAQWEWLWVDSGDVIRTVATQSDTDSAHVPDYWDTANPDGTFSGMSSTLDTTAAQSSTSSVVNYLEALRFFTAGYVQQGLDYAGG